MGVRCSVLLMALPSGAEGRCGGTLTVAGRQLPPLSHLRSRQGAQAANTNIKPGQGPPYPPIARERCRVSRFVIRHVEAFQPLACASIRTNVPWFAAKVPR